MVRIESDICLVCMAYICGRVRQRKDVSHGDNAGILPKPSLLCHSSFPDHYTGTVNAIKSIIITL